MNPPDAGWMEWMNKLGWPLFLLMLLVLGIFFAVRGLWKWFQPHLDEWVKARIEREKAMADSIKTMTEKTIEIQNATSSAIVEIKQKIPEACKWKPSTQ